jgi:hypothetical protein
VLKAIFEKTSPCRPFLCQSLTIESSPSRILRLR